MRDLGVGLVVDFLTVLPVSLLSTAASLSESSENSSVWLRARLAPDLAFPFPFADLAVEGAACD